MTYQREETRWAKIETEHRYREERSAELMASDKAKRNANSVAYNPLTLEYDNSYNGEARTRRPARAAYPHRLVTSKSASCRSE